MFSEDGLKGDPKGCKPFFLRKRGFVEKNVCYFASLSIFPWNNYEWSVDILN